MVNHSGLCHCGCGEVTNLMPWNDPQRGWIKGQHYRFVHNHNSRVPIEIRLMEGIELSGDGCWLWTKSIDYGGYGRIGQRGVNARAHRVSYEHFVGPIPDGLSLDHLCRNRRCVNPDHLEPVTGSENTRRGIAAGNNHGGWRDGREAGG